MSSFMNSSFRIFTAWTVALLFLVLPDGGAVRADEGYQPASVLPDLSGIAWMCDDLFIAVHDRKSFEMNVPRVSLLKVPSTRGGLLWLPLDVKFPGGVTNDLESVSRVPEPGEDSGRKRLLLAESTGGQQDNGFYRRLFLASLEQERLTILDTLVWPEKTHNVEATAVARVGAQAVFIYAERGLGEAGTRVKFAKLSLEPFRLGTFQTAGTFASPGYSGPHERPITAMDVDSSGQLYAASAEDPDDDNGPFRSAVYRIGKVVEEQGEAKIILFQEAVLLGFFDGFKVEGIALREIPGRGLELFIGSDDENYGGAFRPVRVKSGQ